LHWLLRILGAVLLLLAVAGPLGDRLLHVLLPWQGAAYARLLPDFGIERFELVSQGGSLKVAAEAVSQHYFVLQGHAVPPQAAFSAETPARGALATLSLIGAGSIFVLRGRRWWAGAAVAATGAGLLMVLMPAVTLAGAQWAVVVVPFSEVSVEALLGGASDLLQHGGGYGLSAAVLLVARKVGRDAGR
jgi:hypothetical protein